jgi:signal transduction histidine kinase
MIKLNVGEKPIIPVINITQELAEYYEGNLLRMQQILLNLVTNEIKFTSSGCVSLNLTLTHGAIDQPAGQESGASSANHSIFFGY